MGYQPTYIMYAECGGGDIYPCLLQAVQPIGWEYSACSNHASQHISYSTTSSAANQLGILCALQSCQLTYILVCYKQCSWLAGNIMHAPIMPTNIYPGLLQAVQL